ncbi:hypothetical protein PPYR_06340 [Photinus pyralis]|uniref:Uncharacterized protein n=1 Tax=Photinus pyralis TaxID=7054 RepID=A0A5N4ATQ3_PHOPY|nr:hypothetical protein PPYR_06340 [Photinus pyralis]
MATVTGRWRCTTKGERDCEICLVEDDGSTKETTYCGPRCFYSGIYCIYGDCSTRTTLDIKRSAFQLLEIRLKELDITQENYPKECFKVTLISLTEDQIYCASVSVIYEEIVINLDSKEMGFPSLLSGFDNPRTTANIWWNLYL